MIAQAQRLKSGTLLDNNVTFTSHILNLSISPCFYFFLLLLSLFEKKPPRWLPARFWGKVHKFKREVGGRGAIGLLLEASRRREKKAQSLFFPRHLKRGGDNSTIGADQVVVTMGGGGWGAAKGEAHRTSAQKNTNFNSCDELLRGFYLPAERFLRPGVMSCACRKFTYYIAF